MKRTGSVRSRFSKSSPCSSHSLARWRSAFGTGSRISIERARRGSNDIRLGIGEDLKTRVFEALRLSVDGFLHHEPNRVDPHTLTACRADSFILLYRILFILYAEIWDCFVPTKSSLYRESLPRTHATGDRCASGQSGTRNPGRVCQLVEKSECDIRRLTSTVQAATAAAVTCGISCQPSIFRTLI